MYSHMMKFLQIIYLALVVGSSINFAFVKATRIEKLRRDALKIFYHAYDGYMSYAYPLDELRPLTCDGQDTWGSYSLTLIDALDTLAVIGNVTEFRKVVALITERENFDIDINASVFETNIRIVGGLLSGHLLSKKMGVNVSKEWPCEGPLLSLATDVATRLLPAFDTPTGMPYGTVNLRYGVPEGETPITCTAAVGTYIMEFGTISKLTGNPVYEKVALRAIQALWQRRSPLGLLGNHIDVVKGQWTALDSGIGAGVDSFFEYLVKGSYLFQYPELLDIFQLAKQSIEMYLRHNDWYLWATMNKAQVSLAVFQSLEAFWPGILSLIGEVEDAKRILLNYHQVWRKFGFTPEFYSISKMVPYNMREGYPLRPELIESIMYLHQATRDDIFLDMGADILTSIQHSAKTKCGYATIKSVVNHSLDNRMESFFLAETTKYLYLLFHEDNFIHNDGKYGVPHVVRGKTCMLETAYFFNTEAHPIDVGALQCCDRSKNNIDDIVDAIILNPSAPISLKEHLPQKHQAENNHLTENIDEDVDSDMKQKNIVESTDSDQDEDTPRIRPFSNLFDLNLFTQQLNKFVHNMTSSRPLLCPTLDFGHFYRFGGQITAVP